MFKPFFLTLFFASTLFATTLTTMTQALEPKWILKDKQIQGLSVDILNAIEKHAKQEVNFYWENKLYPIKRLLKHLKADNIDFAIGIAYSKERAKNYIFSEPLYKVNYLLAKRVGDAASITSFNELKALGRAGTVMTNFGGKMEKVLRAQEGLHVITLNKKPPALLQELAKGTVRFFYFYEYGMQRMINKAGLQDKLSIMPHALYQDTHHIAFSKKVPKELIALINNIINTMKESGEMQAIYNKYSKDL